MADSEDVTFSGAKLKRLRLRHGWSLRDLSARTQIDFTVLARYERGDQSPQPRKLPVLAKALGAEVDDLLTGPKDEAA
jgi:transcriptional regulator with XRE-family HTH domain